MMSGRISYPAEIFQSDRKQFYGHWKALLILYGEIKSKTRMEKTRKITPAARLLDFSCRLKRGFNKDIAELLNLFTGRLKPKIFCTISGSI